MKNGLLGKFNQFLKICQYIINFHRFEFMVVITALLLRVLPRFKTLHQGEKKFILAHLK